MEFIRPKENHIGNRASWTVRASGWLLWA